MPIFCLYTYIPSRSVGDICKGKLIFWWVHNSFSYYLYHKHNLWSENSPNFTCYITLRPVYSSSNSFFLKHTGGIKLNWKFSFLYNFFPGFNSFKPEKNWNQKGHFLVNFNWVTMPKFILMSLFIRLLGHSPSQIFLLSQSLGSTKLVLLKWHKYGILNRVIRVWF